MNVTPAINGIRRAALWAALTVIILLVLFSIYGAFLGADTARQFFNSLPLAVYWITFGLLLITAIGAFPRLLRVPSLLLIHIGCVLILAGGLWGSQPAHRIRKTLLGIDKIPRGQLAVYEGKTENRVVLDDAGEVAELPFSVRLSDFRIEYYEPGTLQIETGDGVGFRIPAKEGQEFFLGDDYGSVTIVKTYRNFKITIDGNARTAVDTPGAAENPAVEVLLKGPDGQTTTKYVFERFAGHAAPGDRFQLSYYLTIRDYISEIEVIKDGQPVARKTIEVNHPLHFAGYGFYQHDWDKEAGQYTVLQVVSLSGLNCVYAGYAALCAGLFWHLWIRKLLRKTAVAHNAH